MPTLFLSRIEPLEARIAPAGVFTYIDVDGDLVTIKTSKGTNTQLADIVVPFLSSEGVPNGQELNFRKSLRQQCRRGPRQNQHGHNKDSADGFERADHHHRPSRDMG